MGLPAWLSVDGLKRRIDRSKDIDDVLLAELLEEAFAQVQEAPPAGTGRLLTPDPAPVDGADTADPVTRTLTARGRRLILPDARSITTVTLGEGEDTETVAGYRLIKRPHETVACQIELPESIWERRERLWDLYEPIGRCEPPDPRVVAVTGRFGFLTVSAAVRGAIYTLAARAYFERAAGFADNVAVGEGAAASIYNRSIPASARLTLERFALPLAYGGAA